MRVGWKYDPITVGGGRVGDPPRIIRTDEDAAVMATRLAEYHNPELVAMLFYREHYPAYLEAVLMVAHERQCSFAEAQMYVELPTELVAELPDLPMSPNGQVHIEFAETGFQGEIALLRMMHQPLQLTMDWSE